LRQGSHALIELKFNGAAVASRYTPPSVIATNPNQADASLCLCVQFLIGGLYCYNNSFHQFHK